MSPFRNLARKWLPKPVRHAFVYLVDTVAGHRGKHHTGGAR